MECSNKHISKSIYMSMFFGKYKFEVKFFRERRNSTSGQLWLMEFHPAPGSPIVTAQLTNFIFAQPAPLSYKLTSYDKPIRIPFPFSLCASLLPPPPPLSVLHKCLQAFYFSRQSTFFSNNISFLSFYLNDSLLLFEV